MIIGNDDMLAMLVVESGDLFERIFQEMNHPEKTTARSVLVYFDKVLDYLFKEKYDDDIKPIHIHFPMVLDQLNQIVLEFLTIKLFYRSFHLDNSESDYIDRRIDALQAKISRLMYFPENAKGMNGRNKKYRDQIKQRDTLGSELRFISSFKDSGKGFTPHVVINLLVHDSPLLSNSLYSCSLEDWTKNRTNYVLYNDDSFGKVLNEFAQAIGLGLVRDIVLFDCSSRSQFSTISTNYLEQYIPEGLAPETLIVVSFGKSPFRLKRLIQQCGSIYQRHFSLASTRLPLPTAHIFSDNEIRRLLGDTLPDHVVNWINGGEEELGEFVRLIHSFDLPELRSIFVFNLFMVSISSKVAGHILQQLFDASESPNFFRAEIREAIQELTDNEQKELRAGMSVLLEKIAEVWYSYRINLIQVIRRSSRAIVFLVPHCFVNDKVFKKEFQSLISNDNFVLCSWKDVKAKSLRTDELFILNYKDPGRYPFNIYPNLVELKDVYKGELQIHLLSAFFQHRYEQCLREYHGEAKKWFRSKFRKKYLGQTDVVAPPSVETEFFFNDIEDQEFDLEDPATTIGIHFVGGGRISMYPAKPVLVRRPGENEIRVVRADSLGDDDKGVEMQALEDLYVNLNLFQITPAEESELAAIKRGYELNPAQDVLWKVLLARKRQVIGDNEIYQAILRANGSGSFIGYQYFRQNWLDPHSELMIPRRRKHFKVICDYLNLPASYYRLKLKKSASEKWNKRVSTKKMNRLLAQLFNEGLFDQNIDWATVPLTDLLHQHDLEAHGVTDENVRTEISALVYLLKENLQFRTIHHIELP